MIYLDEISLRVLFDSIVPESIENEDENGLKYSIFIPFDILDHIVNMLTFSDLLSLSSIDNKRIKTRRDPHSSLYSFFHKELLERYFRPIYEIRWSFGPLFANQNNDVLRHYMKNGAGDVRRREQMTKEVKPVKSEMVCLLSTDSHDRFRFLGNRYGEDGVIETKTWFYNTFTNGNSSVVYYKIPKNKKFILDTSKPFNIWDKLWSICFVKDEQYITDQDLTLRSCLGFELSALMHTSKDSKTSKTNCSQFYLEEYTRSEKRQDVPHLALATLLHILRTTIDPNNDDFEKLMSSYRRARNLSEEDVMNFITHNASYMTEGNDHIERVIGGRIPDDAIPVREVHTVQSRVYVKAKPKMTKITHSQ